MLDQVFFICNYAADYAGNFMGSLNALERQLLAKHGTNVVYVLPPEAAEKTWCLEMVTGGHKIEYAEFTPKALGAYFKTRELVGNCILHFHFGTVKDVYAVRRAIRKKKNAKLVVHLHMRQDHGSQPLVGRLKFYIKALAGRVVYRNLSLVCVSPGTWEDAKRYYKSSPSYGIFNAIDTSRLSAPTVRPEPNKLLIFGTDYKRKGVDLVIRAVMNMEQKPRLLVIVHNIERTKANIEEDFGGVPSFVDICKPREDIVSLYHAAFVFLSPSRSEAFAYAVSEAAYCGCQVIASDIPGQNVQKNIPGIQWVESENVTQLREAIERAYVRAQDHEDLLEENRKQQTTIESSYALHAWCGNIMDLYENIAMTF